MRWLHALAPMLEIGLVVATVAYGAAIIDKATPAPAVWCDYNRVFVEPEYYVCGGVLIMPNYSPSYGKPTIMWETP